MSTPTTLPYQGQMVPGQDMKFEPVKEEWNEYELEDGSIVRVRTVVSNIIVTKEKTATGDPLIGVRSTTVVVYNPPASQAPHGN